jgi:hypothetical protein
VTASRRHRSRGQTLVEFALISPIFLLVIFATIDFGGYFGARLSVENAARDGARVAAVQPLKAYSTTAGATIVAAIRRQANDFSASATLQDCYWSGPTLSPTQYPPFNIPTGSTGCVGIWYFELSGTGSPTLCSQWSLTESGQWGLWSGTFPSETWTPQPSGPPAGCVSPPTPSGVDLVVIGVGYKYSALTPMPTIASGALVTYGETELMEEQ